MKEVGIDDQFESQDIKYVSITEEQIDHMALLNGGYEGLFSRQARKYKEMGLKSQTLSEQDYRRLIINH
jgi:arsenate reductase